MSGKKKAFRKTVCPICSKSMPIASTGRVRLTCSDRCRQIKKRYKSWIGWRDNVYFKRDMRRAETWLRQIERKVGSLAVPVMPDDPYFTLRDQLRIRLMRVSRGNPWRLLTFCVECERPYVADTYRKHMVCSNKCRKKFKRYENRIRATLAENQQDAAEILLKPMLRHKWLKICKHCSVVFKPRNKLRQYCSDKCKNAAYWKRRPERKCGCCGARYRGTRLGCSKRCYEVLHYRDSQHCGRCNKVVRRGAEILPNADTRMPTGIKRRKWSQAVVFCSGRCRDALGWLPMRKVCEECGDGYYANSHHAYRTKRYCGDVCQNRAAYRRWAARRAERETPIPIPEWVLGGLGWKMREGVAGSAGIAASVVLVE